MKPSILLLAFVILALSSCTTAYKTGQTPDDVYYSPARPVDEYVQVNDRDNREYRYDDEYYDDRYLRMKVRNRERWSDLDEWYSYGKNYSYRYSYYSPWGYSWNPYSSWNYYYNPYCRSCCVVSNVKTGTVYSKPRNFNLNTYNPNNNPKGKLFGYSTSPGNTSYSSPRTQRAEPEKGNILRDIFKSNSSSSSGSSSSSTSTKSSSSGSSGSGKSSSAPVRKF
jgi:hypothetical protein